MSEEIYGIDCVHPGCVHDTLRGYRLHIDVRRSADCKRCWHHGEPMGPQENLMGHIENNWVRCAPCNVQWRTEWVPERKDMIFRPFQLDAAYAQMSVLGVTEPGTGVFLVERHVTLPIGYDARRLMFREEPMPRLCLYFRYNPLAGEKLTPNNVFQMMFPPNASAAERRKAPGRYLTSEEFLEITQVNDTGLDGVHTTWSSLRCQHCMRPIPLRALSTLTLRQCDVGD